MQQYGAYLYEQYQAALGMDERTELEASDMGYWSEPYQLSANDQEAISYSVPLILENGTVYGVLGVELSLSYLKDMLPSEELKDKDAGSYLLGIEKNSDTEITNVLISGSGMYPKPADRDQECFHSSSRLHRTANPNVRRNCLVSG